jgi:YegS/Rv2252/BmrU family lipid kinase
MAGMAEGYGTGFLVVTNAAAGSHDEDRVEEALEVLRAGADVRHEECADPADWDRLLDLRAGRTVVVVGGDGSLHTAVSAAWRRGQLASVRFGLVPLGTGNDFARSAGIPLDDPAEAARSLLSSEPRSLDLLFDDSGGVVVNVVHAGVGAEAAARATPLKPGLGKAAYAVGSVVAGTTATGWELQVSVDGRLVQVDGNVLMVAVANGRTIGGGSEVAPDALPDDGLLDVVVATSTGPLARLGFGIAMREGEHLERDDVVTVRGRTATVSGEPFPVNADGELEEDVRSRTWTVEPAAWALRCPASRQ